MIINSLSYKTKKQKQEKKQDLFFRWTYVRTTIDGVADRPGKMLFVAPGFGYVRWYGFVLTHQVPVSTTGPNWKAEFSTYWHTIWNMRVRFYY